MVFNGNIGKIPFLGVAIMRDFTVIWKKFIQNFRKGGYVRNPPDNVFGAVSCFIETFGTIISRLGAFKIEK